MVKFLPKILDPDPDPVYRQNLIVSSLAHVLPFHDFFSKIGRVVLRNPAYKQTNKRTKEQKTNADENVTFLAEVVNREFAGCAILALGAYYMYIVFRKEGPIIGKTYNNIIVIFFHMSSVKVF